MSGNLEFWNQYAGEWSRNIDENADVQRNEFIAPTFIRFVGQVSGRRLVDLGCGEGDYARHYAGQGNDVTAVDYSQAMIDIAQAKSVGGGSIRFMCDDMTSLSQLRDDEYDVALAPMSLMDCSTLPPVFEAVFRKLRSGGSLFASVLHPCFFTVSSRWEIEEGKAISRNVAEYFASEPQLVRWTNSTHPERQLVRSYQYPHRVESYLNGALGAGLQLVKIEEPPIPKEYLDRNGPRHEAWARHAALILLMHFTKP